MRVVGRKHTVNVYCIIAGLVSFLLFLKCYFPIKRGLSGYASFNQAPQEPVTGRGGVPNTRHNRHRVVLMVIDALRADFVLGDKNYMPFTRQMLHDGHGVSFVAKTQTPTVTLPRIKAITSGSIPGYIDVVLNFGAAAWTDDNLLTQLKLAGKTQVFYGDDTWLNLFPDHFARADGTTSFYVTDYTEVDLNVTRHLKKEMAADDWDMMAMHYLGLDHIGHMFGPASDLIPPKLLEMDSVVKQLYTAMTVWNAEHPGMLIICGDHGMNDIGGHGAATPGETNVPVVMLSPHIQFQPQKTLTGGIQQIDLCPTLSALIGLPIPLNNLGRVVVGALPLPTSLQDKVRYLQLNAAQMAAILAKNVDDIEADHTYQLYQDVLIEHASWLSARNSSTAVSWEAVGTRVLSGYQDAVQKISERISQTSTTYDMYGIVVAIVSLWMNLFIQVFGWLNDDAPASLSSQTVWFVGVPVLMAATLSHVTLCTSQHSSDILCGTSLVSLIVLFVMLGILLISCVLLVWLGSLALKNTSRSNRKPMSWLEVTLAGCTVIYSLSLLSSSFVEEEHQTWYFLSTSFHTFLLLHPLSILATQIAQPRAAQSASSNTPSRSGVTEFRGSRVSSESRSSYSRFHSTVDRDDKLGCSQEVKDSSSSSQWHPEEMHTGQALKMVVSLVGILTLLRILRSWNQTGNKWLHVPDIGDWLNKPQNISYLSLLVLVSLLGLFAIRFQHLPGGVLSRLVFASTLVSVYLSKAASGFLILPPALADFLSTEGILEARLVYLFTLVLLLHSIKSSSSQNTSTDESIQVSPDSVSNSIADKVSYSQKDPYLSQCHLHHGKGDSRSTILTKDKEEGVTHKTSQLGAKQRHTVLEGIQTVWLLLMCVLFRRHNIALVVMLSAVEALTTSFVLPFVGLSPGCLLLYCLMMGQTSFFFQGNSNSISTVDVSSGMTALHDYNPVIMGTQIAMTTYATIVFWILTACKRVNLSAPFHGAQQWLSKTYTKLCNTALLTRALPVAIYTLLATVLRYHLFVWTVFSPKLLVEGSLTIILSTFGGVCLLIATYWRKMQHE